MGLMKRRDELKKLEMKLTFLELMKEEFGIEISDLHYLHEAVEIVKEMKKKNLENPNNNANPKMPDDDMKKKFKENENKMTPEEFISQFGGESEEFYPYGKPKANNN